MTRVGSQRHRKKKSCIMRQSTEGESTVSIGVIKIFILLVAFSFSCIGLLFISKVVQTP